MSMVIVAMSADDWPQVAEIYRQGIETRMATFETEVPPWEVWDANHIADCRLVVRGDDGSILGWAALSPVSSRCVYGGVAEHSIYIAVAARGLGVGKVLLNALVEESEQAGFWTIQSSVFPENAASMSLHRACGFREVGYRERIGQLDGVWRNTVLIERRSTTVGVNGA